MNPSSTWRNPIRSLQEFATRKRPADSCELCALALPERHQHLIDPSERKLICACDGCAILFDSQGLTKYRRVPREIRLLSDFQLPREQWESLLVPIRLAFFYRSSHVDRVVALYPSPAGVTESLIDLEPWQALESANPPLKELRDDVEALLVNRLKDRQEYFIAPMDRCFELVGRVRRHWEGFSGGDRVWNEVDSFMSRLREEAGA